MAPESPSWGSESLFLVGQTGYSVGWEGSWTWTQGNKRGEAGDNERGWHGEFVGRSVVLLPGDRGALLSSDSFGNLFL